jgi:hypothetical protein
MVGYWDEEFYPAYFEDNDWDRRIKLNAPDKLTSIPITGKHIGSVTVKRMNEEELKIHHEQFDENRERYILKWGGVPGKERFLVPFGSKMGS